MAGPDLSGHFCAKQSNEGKFVYYSSGDKNLGTIIDSALKYLKEGRS
jgi:hypothetical protein